MKQERIFRFDASIKEDRDAWENPTEESPGWLATKFPHGVPLMFPSGRELIDLCDLLEDFDIADEFTRYRWTIRIEIESLEEALG